MKNNVQFYGKNDVQINPEDKKFLTFPEEIPLPHSSLFPNYSSRLPEPKTVSSLEAFVRNMEHAVERGEGMCKMGSCEMAEMSMD